MIEFFKNCKQISGKKDTKFGFGFDDKTEIILTRGNQNRKEYNLDYHDFVFENRIKDIRSILR